MSRPEKPIDWDRVDFLLAAGCLGTEIAAFFDMHPETFYRKVQKEYNTGFTVFCSEKRAKGDSMIRAAQFESAVKDKNTSMLIWLGKTRLDQKEPESRSFVRVAEEFDKTLEVVKPDQKDAEKKEEA